MTTNYCKAARRITARQEKFAREVVAGASGAEAARRAGYSARRANRAAYEVMTNRDVMHRIEELHREAVARVPMTLEEHLRRLADLRDEASLLGLLGAAIQAEALRGKAMGFYRKPTERPDVAAEAVRAAPDEQRRIFREALYRMVTEEPRLLEDVKEVIAMAGLVEAEHASDKLRLPPPG